MIKSIVGYRDEHALGMDSPGGEAGLIMHKAGVGQVRVLVDDEHDEIYIKGKDLERFAKLYRVVGSEAIVSMEERPLIRRGQ